MFIYFDIDGIYIIAGTTLLGLSALFTNLLHLRMVVQLLSGYTNLTDEI